MKRECTASLIQGGLMTGCVAATIGLAIDAIPETVGYLAVVFKWIIPISGFSILGLIGVWCSWALTTACHKVPPPPPDDSSPRIIIYNININLGEVTKLKNIPTELMIGGAAFPYFRYFFSDQQVIPLLFLIIGFTLFCIGFLLKVDLASVEQGERRRLEPAKEVTPVSVARST